jgi:Calpain family cysteine protease
MAIMRQYRPATVGRRAGIWIVLVLGATLAPARWLDAGPTPGDPDGFAAQVAAHFGEWDLDRNGTLSFRELGGLVPDVRIKGKAACALAAIRRVQRGKDPAWRHAAFSRDDLIGPHGGTETAHRPPFERDYRQHLAHLRATRRVLFAPGAPGLQDIHQGPLGDCFLIAVVGAVVRRDPGTLREMIDQMPDGTFLVRFPGGPMIPVPSVSDAEVMLGSNDGNQGIWLNVIEKAYGELVLARRGLEAPAIEALSAAGTSTKTLQLFTGHEGLRLRFRPHGSPHIPGRAEIAASAPRARAILIEAQLDRRLTCCGTTTAATPPGITPNHIYAVLGYDPARDVVHVWNPWGNHFTPAGPPGLAAGYPVQDGHFSVSLDDFIRIFAAITYESRRPAAPIRTGLR